ncbi:hypothetical protein HNY73_003146 [Argiope bruennichi]|uniref:Uncharacterized protein n=1 Tax=Argiope bruennichi TaxID=94029 RepID=A0A8T0FYD1_ARGBR|nr:hypothetical protein HNY73_003146 [Argiope bruennichi]
MPVPECRTSYTHCRRQCSEPESKNDYFGGKFTRYCPCVEGLVCEPNKPGITDPEKRRKALRCQKPSATTVGPDVTTASNIVTDGEIVDTTRGEIVTDGEIVDTTRGEIVTDPEIVTDDIVDETLPPEIVTDEETEAPEETEEPEVVETEEPEVVETEEPEVVETEEPEVVETEEPEEVVETEEPEEVVETEEPEEVVEPEEPEEVVEPEEPETPEEEVVEEAGQRGPGGERPRTDDPDCEDWTYGC